MKTETDTRAELRGVGKLGLFKTATSPPHEGEPMVARERERDRERERERESTL